MTVQFSGGDGNGRVSSLTFYLARYSIEGNFLGFQELKTQMSLCPTTYDDVLKMMQFGSVIENQCEFSLTELLDQTNLPPEANTFFELYI